MTHLQHQARLRMRSLSFSHHTVPEKTCKCSRITCSCCKKCYPNKMMMVQESFLCDFQNRLHLSDCPNKQNKRYCSATNLCMYVVRFLLLICCYCFEDDNGVSITTYLTYSSRCWDHFLHSTGMIVRIFPPRKFDFKKTASNLTVQKKTRFCKGDGPKGSILAPWWWHKLPCTPPWSDLRFFFCVVYLKAEMFGHCPKTKGHHTRGNRRNSARPIWTNVYGNRFVIFLWKCDFLSFPPSACRFSPFPTLFYVFMLRYQK